MEQLCIVKSGEEIIHLQCADIEEEGTEDPLLPCSHKKEEEVDAEEATAAIVVGDNNTARQQTL